MGRKPPELENLVDLPQSCWHIWVWFLELNSARSNNGFSANPISYLELKAYFDLMHLTPSEHEVRLIKRFDNLYLKLSAEKSDKENNKK